MPRARTNPWSGLIWGLGIVVAVSVALGFVAAFLTPGSGCGWNAQTVADKILAKQLPDCSSGAQESPKTAPGTSSSAQTSTASTPAPQPSGQPSAPSPEPQRTPFALPD